MSNATPTIRKATESDIEAVFRVLEPAIREGETLCVPRDADQAAALSYWYGTRGDVFVAELNGEIVGTYYLRTNQLGGGAHVANAGYATHPSARGHGIARSLCEHSIANARSRGYRALQFNFVVSTNTRALELWQRCGFAVVGRLPGAFAHPQQGFVDGLVMFQTL